MDPHPEVLVASVQEMSSIRHAPVRTKPSITKQKGLQWWLQAGLPVFCSQRHWHTFWNLKTTHEFFFFCSTEKAQGNRKTLPIQFLLPKLLLFSVSTRKSQRIRWRWGKQHTPADALCYRPFYAVTEMATKQPSRAQSWTEQASTPDNLVTSVPQAEAQLQMRFQSKAKSQQVTMAQWTLHSRTIKATDIASWSTNLVLLT